MSEAYWKKPNIHFIFIHHLSFVVLKAISLFWINLVKTFL